MAQHCERTRLQTVSTGLLFLLSGLAVWAGARGWYSPREAHAWWPLGFVFPAVHYLTAPPPERNVFSGLGFLALGAVLIGRNLGYVHLRLRDLVPLVLVVIGLRLLYVAGQRRGVRS